MTNNIKELLKPPIPQKSSDHHSRDALSVLAPAFSASVSIVIAYLEHSSCSYEQVGALLREIHGVAIEALKREEAAEYDGGAPVGGRATVTPAVSIEDSVGDDYIICLEDGKKVKSLRAHLRRRYGMTTEQYKLKWKLPDSYPIVAPALSRKRSLNAKKMNLHHFRSAMHPGS